MAAESTHYYDILDSLGEHRDYSGAKMEQALGPETIWVTLARVYILEDAAVSTGNSAIREYADSCIKRTADQLRNYVLGACSGELRWVLYGDADCSIELRDVLLANLPEDEAQFMRALMTFCASHSLDATGPPIRESIIQAVAVGSDLGEIPVVPALAALRTAHSLNPLWRHMRYDYNGGYGGPPWAGLAQLGLDYAENKMSPMSFIDAIVDSVHNGGWALGKYYSATGSLCCFDDKHQNPSSSGLGGVFQQVGLFTGYARIAAPRSETIPPSLHYLFALKNFAPSAIIDTHCVLEKWADSMRTVCYPLYLHLRRRAKPVHENPAVTNLGGVLLNTCKDDACTNEHCTRKQLQNYSLFCVCAACDSARANISGIVGRMPTLGTLYTVAAKLEYSDLKEIDEAVAEVFAANSEVNPGCKICYNALYELYRKVDEKLCSTDLYTRARELYQNMGSHSSMKPVETITTDHGYAKLRLNTVFYPARVPEWMIEGGYLDMSYIPKGGLLGSDGRTLGTAEMGLVVRAIQAKPCWGRVIRGGSLAENEIEGVPYNVRCEGGYGVGSGVGFTIDDSTGCAHCGCDCCESSIDCGHCEDCECGDDLPDTCNECGCECCAEVKHCSQCDGCSCLSYKEGWCDCPDCTKPDVCDQCGCECCVGGSGYSCADCAGCNCTGPDDEED